MSPLISIDGRLATGSESTESILDGPNDQREAEKDEPRADVQRVWVGRARVLLGVDAVEKEHDGDRSRPNEVVSDK